ncbi:hypothetical protein FSP39_003107 [Pinctada imbricata]|uniref:R3H domain-containing protein 2 n=1 Tax=Pinctada imbricata TaxID=66713 RepID=A0AA88YPT5_PINIB|nr:hypothetical protein FSP39_003107 [Pinctada imbricata]
MTMAAATEYRQDSRGKGAVLCKQSEIEETDEHEPDTSPGSDQSDATITTEGKHICIQTQNLTNQTPPLQLRVPQKVKQLQRSKAFEESPPPEQHTLLPQANGLGQKSLSHDRLSKSGSQSSEAGSSCFSRDSSFDKSPYKDSTGINLEDFIHKTINKSPKDRTMLLKLETDLINFVNEPKHHYLKFPPMSSYDRMLVHRIAAFFGLDHNVDQTGKSVIVNKTSNKRIPDFSFSEHIDNMEMGDRKSAPIKVMKRGGLSLDDKESYCKTLEKPLLANTKARSFEERKKQYDKVRSKIFNSCDEVCDCTCPVLAKNSDSVITNKKPQRPSSLSKNSDGPPWSSTDSSGYGTDCSSKSRGIPKANSFGGIPHNQIKAPLKSQSLCKTDSVSSGTQSPNVAHVIAAPTPPGSRSDSSPLSRSSSTGPIQSPLNQGYPPGQGQQVFWVASDYRNIPPGSVIINQQTG